MGNLDFNSSLPLIKDELNFTKFLIPKLKLKINPSDMKNYSETDRKMNVLNIFSTNRLGRQTLMSRTFSNFGYRL